ncbi:S8 family peptidase [Halobacteriales archaeon Cl-PHB]
MSRHGNRAVSRRQLLKTGGVALGGLTLGTAVTSGASSGRYLVRPKRNGSLSGVTVEEELPGLGFVAVSGREKDVKRTARQYAPDPVLDIDEPAVSSQVPDDAAESRDEPLYDLQWDKQDLNVPEAHDTTRGEGTRVAIIDSGVYADHPDLQGTVNLDLSQNFSGDGLGVGKPYGGYHGTHVAGIVAASDTNDVGVVGTAPGAELVDCRVFPYGEGAPFSVILAALLHSVDVDADVANLSLGAYAPRRSYVDDGRFGRFYGKALNSALTYANTEGTLVVMSAGNSGADLQHDKQWISLPNEGAKGLSISATGPIGFGWGDPGLEADYASPAFYTNYGTNAVDLGAPGGDADLETDNPGYYLDLVLSTVAEFERDEDGNIVGGPTPSWSWAAGTSMAAPNVSGAAALVKAVNPDYNPNQVKSALTGAASVPAGYDKTYYGSGYLNILDAL